MSDFQLQVTVTTKVSEPNCPHPFPAPIVKLYIPGVVGVPEITPNHSFTTNPGGRGESAKKQTHLPLSAIRLVVHIKEKFSLQTTI